MAGGWGGFSPKVTLRKPGRVRIVVAVGVFFHHEFVIQQKVILLLLSVWGTF